MSDLPFLDSEGTEPAPQIETVAEPAPQVEEPVIEPAPVEPDPLVAPVVDHKPEPGFVPITALMDERDKRKALEAQLQQATARPQEPVHTPDVFEDPEGFAAYQASLAINAKLDVSEEMARDKFGDELVDQAREWALQQYQSRPGFQQQVLGQRNPYRFVVEQYQREQIASQVDPGEFEQFKAWKAAQAQVAQPVPAAPQAPLPPRSLASIPSSGGATHVPVGPGQAFDSLFNQ